MSAAVAAWPRRVLACVVAVATFGAVALAPGLLPGASAAVTALGASNNVTANFDQVATNGAILIDVTANDDVPDGVDHVELVPEAPPVGGTVSVEGNQIRYVPNLGFQGDDPFSYVVFDPDGDSSRNVVVVHVYIGHPVIAVPDPISVAAGQTAVVDVLANDEAQDSPVTVSIDADTSLYAGTVSVVCNRLRYVAPSPAVDESVTYYVTDADGDVGVSYVQFRADESQAGGGDIGGCPVPAAATIPAAVAPSVSAALSRPVAPLKSLVTMSGKVSTAAATVTLQRQSGTSWVNVSAMVVRANGTYTFKVPTSASGRAAYSVTATDTSLTTARSATKTLSVFSASITKVHAAGAEYVIVKNSGKVSVALRGMKLKDKHGKSMTLPAFTLRAGKSVTISTGKGKVTRTQLHVGKKLNLWSKHDVARLLDSAGVLVAQKKY